MKTTYIIFTTFILTVLVSCHTKKVSRETSRLPEKPAWIINRPVAEGYYTGIGVASVNSQYGNHIEVAKSNALNDIVSEISVTISSKAIIRQFENDKEFKEEFESFSDATIRDNIEGYELVDSWGDHQHYWVYYKLSKQHYRSIKERKLTTAKALAYDFYQKAGVHKSNDDIASALNFYLKAMHALRYHLDEELSLMTDNGKIFLANEILSEVINLYSQIEVRTDQLELTTKIAKPIDTTITFSVVYQKSPQNYLPVRNLPFRIYFYRGSGELTSSAVTNEIGKSSFKLGRVTGNYNFQEVKLEIDIQSMMEGDDKQSELLGEMIGLKSTVPSGKVHLVVSPLIAYYQVKEDEFGSPSARSPMKNEIKTYLAKNFFTFTNEQSEADVNIRLETRASEGGYNERHDLYTVFMDCYLSIFDAKTAHKIYYKGFDQVRGQQVGSLGNGLKEAQLTTLKRVREEILPEIHQLDF